MLSRDKCLLDEVLFAQSPATLPPPPEQLSEHPGACALPRPHLVSFAASWAEQLGCTCPTPIGLPACPCSAMTSLGVQTQLLSPKAPASKCFLGLGSEVVWRVEMRCQERSQQRLERRVLMINVDYECDRGGGGQLCGRQNCAACTSPLIPAPTANHWIILDN